MKGLVHPSQVVPSAFPAREALREKGQFWTPGWLADVMAEWVIQDSPAVVFDPAVGPGTFFVASRRAGYLGKFEGFEIDRYVLDLALEHGLTMSDVAGVRLGDFIAEDRGTKVPAVISNPPYLRHHRLGEKVKTRLREIARSFLGFELDGRTGLHVFFLLKCLQLLKPDGRLAFLLPADVCESVSASALWRRLTERFHVEAVMRFEGEACPFPRVDTNALVFLIRNAPPEGFIRWIQVTRPDRGLIRRALFEGRETPGVVRVIRRDLSEALDTGLSRPPRERSQEGVRLSSYANVVRGIATGANEFFFKTSRDIRDRGLDPSRFIRAVGRTRDCQEDVLTPERLDELDDEGRPTWLLNLDSAPAESLPRSLRDYLQEGEGLGLHERALIKSRRPWYRMERRLPPPLLFAYLGRRDCRFILNRAAAVPLTGFLCVYPFRASASDVHQLWRALNHPLTIENLAYVGKSYGGGALKVEPRQLDQLLIPDEVIKTFGVRPPDSLTQLSLMEEADDSAGEPRRERRAAMPRLQGSQFRLAREKPRR